jgi:4-methyl-5(b-hydroxyethyl)-thiazole monophosphate biosynthesis
MPVFVFLTDNFEEIEAVTVIDILRRADIRTLTVSVTGSLFVVGSHGIEVKADALFEETDFSGGSALVLPGGPGTANYNGHAGLLALIKDYNEKNRLIAAICAAPTVLANLGLLDGKAAVCYNTDAFPPSVIIADTHTVKYGNIITSKAAATAPHFAFAIVEALKDAETAKNVSEKMFYHIRLLA